MHQPDYRRRGEYLRPWTWLHAIKDYSDMAAHLEANPGARAVVNFSPILLEQLQDYPARIFASLENGMPIRDRILDALAGRMPGPDELPALMQSLLRVNENTVKPRFGHYAQLHELTLQALAETRVLPRPELDDLLTWYVLVWMGALLRDREPLAVLKEKARGFSEQDRRDLLTAVAEIMQELVPRYRAMAESGQIELSLTPYAHPILPLMQSMASARDAWPDVELPNEEYPGGDARCDWHLDEAQAVFQRAFGFAAKGCWPSEGAVSEPTLNLLQQHGYQWAASGAQVLFNSLGRSESQPQLEPWELAKDSGRSESLTCFFRDDELSDRIGFEYSKWDASEAVDDFVYRLEQRANDPGCPENPVLSIIMDGENAWEYYPWNGAEFLQTLYERLASHPRIRLTTFSEARRVRTPRSLEKLSAGSWVYGNFSTWVGDPAKNRAWEVLIAAKRAVDAALGRALESNDSSVTQQAEWVKSVQHQLAVCEASDWFWWLGEDNRLEDGPAFDLLFRQQVAVLYELIGLEPPPRLDEPLNRPAAQVLPEDEARPDGQSPASAGAMKPTLSDTAL